MKRKLKYYRGKHDITGLFFHSFKPNGAVDQQGIVMEWITDNYYLCQSFEWAFGEPSIIWISTLDKMLGWHFYETAAEMKDTYECWIKDYSKIQNDKTKESENANH